MPLQPMQFNFKDFTPAGNAVGGFLKGRQTAQDYRSAQLANAIQGVRAKFAERNAQQELQGAVLGNQKLGQEIEWNPKNWQSEIDLRRNQGKLTESEAAKNQYLLTHPGLMGDETSKLIQSIHDMREKGIIPNQQNTASAASDLSGTSNTGGEQQSHQAQEKSGAEHPIVQALMNKPVSNAQEYGQRHALIQQLMGQSQSQQSGMTAANMPTYSPDFTPVQGNQADQFANNQEMINAIQKQRGLMNNPDQQQMLNQPMSAGNDYAQQQPPEQQAAQAQQPPMEKQQEQSNQQPNGLAGYLQTGDPYVDALINSKLNQRIVATNYQQKMTQGYNWAHLPADTQNQLIAQGYGMGIDPLKMQKYTNEGLGIKEIAEKEGLDPDNMPPPIYAPTTATKTRVQQVEQVGNELDYMGSKTSALIKPYADTLAGVSPEKIKDTFSNNPDDQKRLGRYIAGLSLQTGLNTGRILLEGGRPSVTVMQSIKDTSMAGIDKHAPFKMSKAAYEEAQKTINEVLQSGAKIRTATGMNPMSKIGQSKSSEKADPLGIR